MSYEYAENVKGSPWLDLPVMILSKQVCWRSEKFFQLLPPHVRGNLKQ